MMENRSKTVLTEELNEVIGHLRQAVECRVGSKMQAHKDFLFLSETIFEQTHQTIGVNTLKRLWGHLEEGTIPRISTLNILAQYVGFESWEAFCETSPSSSVVFEDTQTLEDAPQVPHSHSFTLKSMSFLVLLIIAVFALVGAVFYVRSAHQQVVQLQDSLECIQDEKYMLRIGQTFTSYDEYLTLFGLKGVNDYPYFQLHPRHKWLVLWGPEYHHPHWQNDGDSANFMPTITERWAPAGQPSELVALRNSELFYNGRRNNDIRLTFMKGLRGDSLFTYIGVYRFSMSQSDTTHIVWEKVAEECDLQHLELLEQLRN